MNYFKKATELWGDRLQLIKTMEECGELIQAISKYLITTSELVKAPENDYDITKCKINIVEEVCDVDIMLEQVRCIIGKDESLKLFISETMKDKIWGFQRRVKTSMKNEVIERFE